MDESLWLSAGNQREQELSCLFQSCLPTFDWADPSLRSLLWTIDPDGHFLDVDLLQMAPEELFPSPLPEASVMGDGGGSPMDISEFLAVDDDEDDPWVRVSSPSETYADEVSFCRTRANSEMDLSSLFQQETGVVEEDTAHDYIVILDSDDDDDDDGTSEGSAARRMLSVDLCDERQLDMQRYVELARRCFDRSRAVSKSAFREARRLPTPAYLQEMTTRLEQMDENYFAVAATDNRRLMALLQPEMTMERVSFEHVSQIMVTAFACKDHDAWTVLACFVALLCVYDGDRFVKSALAKQALKRAFSMAFGVSLGQSLQSIGCFRSLIACSHEYPASAEV